MADDTRQTLNQGSKETITKSSLTVHPENKPFAGSQWQDAKAQQTYRPPSVENANLLAGGTQNTAGGQVPDVTLRNAFGGELKWSDFTDLPRRPCVRDALMTGIGTGFALGGIRAIFGATIWTACNWAVGSLCFSSAGMYQWCLHKRQAEKEGMMRAVEILNRKDIEKKARDQQREKARGDRRRVKEQELDERFAAMSDQRRIESGGDGGGKPWWKVW